MLAQNQVFEVATSTKSIFKDHTALTATMTVPHWVIRKSSIAIMVNTHLSFDGFSFTMDHCVWSNNAIRTRICLHYFEFYSTHSTPDQKNVTYENNEHKCQLEIFNCPNKNSLLEHGSLECHVYKILPSLLPSSPIFTDFTEHKSRKKWIFKNIFAT